MLDPLQLATIPPALSMPGGLPFGVVFLPQGDLGPVPLLIELHHADVELIPDQLRRAWARRAAVLVMVASADVVPEVASQLRGDLPGYSQVSCALLLERGQVPS